MRVFATLGLLLAGSAQAQVTPTAVFTGTYQESWEVGLGGFPLCQDFSTIGTFCSSCAHRTTGWSFDCVIYAQHQTWFFGSCGNEVTASFTTGLTRFGGYFGTNAPPPVDATLNFYDVGGTLIGSDNS